MKLLREYYALCEGGVCQDLLTEDEKRRVREEGAIILSGVMQMSETQNGNSPVKPFIAHKNTPTQKPVQSGQ